MNKEKYIIALNSVGQAFKKCLTDCDKDLLQSKAISTIEGIQLVSRLDDKLTLDESSELDLVINFWLAFINR